MTIAGIPHWDEAPELYDTCTLAGLTLPGIVKIAGSMTRKLDKKNAKGADGATITDDGANAAEIELALVMWTAAHWEAYQAMVPLINPLAQKGKLSPVDIVHPVLALHGVKSVYVEDVSLPQAGSIPQTREVKIKVVEWRPAPKKPKKSKSTTPTRSQAARDYLWRDNPDYINDGLFHNGAPPGLGLVDESAGLTDAQIEAEYYLREEGTNSDP